MIRLAALLAALTLSVTLMSAPEADASPGGYVAPVACHKVVGGWHGGAGMVGLDVQAWCGSGDVYAVDAGTVTVVCSGAQAQVALTTAEGVWIYGHMQPGGIRPGSVQAGAEIGKLSPLAGDWADGCSGMSTGPHVHLVPPPGVPRASVTFTDRPVSVAAPVSAVAQPVAPVAQPVAPVAVAPVFGSLKAIRDIDGKLIRWEQA